MAFAADSLFPDMLSDAFASQSFGPLRVTSREWFAETKPCTVTALVGYLRSWSSYQSYREARAALRPVLAPETDALHQLEATLRAAFGTGTFAFTTPFFLVVARPSLKDAPPRQPKL